MRWIWRAWCRLQHDRPIYGGGLGAALPGAIPWGVVRAWAAHNGLGRHDMDLLDRCLLALHDEYLRVMAERSKT